MQFGVVFDIIFHFWSIKYYLCLYTVSFVSFAEPKGAETLASRDSSSTISAQTSTMVTVSTLMSLLLGWISH